MFDNQNKNHKGKRAYKELLMIEMNLQVIIA